MEGRGSDVEYWRGETHLGSLLPVSTCCFSYPHVVSHVRTLFPMSTRCFSCLHVISHVCMSLPTSVHCCPCPRVVARVCTSLPMSACHCPRPFMFVGGRFHSWAWVVSFIRGRSSSFGGVRLRSWAVHLHSWATAGCGGGEPLVGGGESSGLA